MVGCQSRPSRVSPDTHSPWSPDLLPGVPVTYRPLTALPSLSALSLQLSSFSTSPPSLIFILFSFKRQSITSLLYTVLANSWVIFYYPTKDFMFQIFQPKPSVDVRHLILYCTCTKVFSRIMVKFFVSTIYHRRNVILLHVFIMLNQVIFLSVVDVFVCRVADYMRCRKRSLSVGDVSQKGGNAGDIPSPRRFPVGCAAKRSRQWCDAALSKL